MHEVFSYNRRPEAAPTPSGDEFLEVFQEEFNKSGNKELVMIGKTNIYDKIQEGRENTEISHILERVALGDLSLLRAQEPQYIDSTTLPKNLMEANNIVLKAKQEFERMPKDVREKFDYSADEYVNTMGTKEWLDKMAPFNEKAAEIKKAGSLKAYNEKVAAQAKFEKDVAAAKEANS